MSGEAVGDDPTTDGGRPADERGAVTWADIYDSPEVDRSLRRLPRLCREAVQLVWAAGRSGTGAEAVLPKLLMLTIVTAGLGFLSAVGREQREVLAELASRYAQGRIIDAAGAAIGIAGVAVALLALQASAYLASRSS